MCEIHRFRFRFRPFTMQLTEKSMYPAYPVDIATNVVLEDSNGTALFRSHSFDKPPLKAIFKKWRKDTINSGDGPLQGLMALRSLYYRANKSKIPATTRMGIKT